MQPFMTVTVHFIKDDKMVSRIFSTFHVPETHTAENLTQRLKDVEKRVKIAKKVICIFTDNGSNIVKAINILSNKYQQQGKSVAQLLLAMTNYDFY
jgi:hypothetical protein